MNIAVSYRERERVLTHGGNPLFSEGGFSSLKTVKAMYSGHINNLLKHKFQSFSVVGVAEFN